MFLMKHTEKVLTLFPAEHLVSAKENDLFPAFLHANTFFKPIYDLIRCGERKLIELSIIQ